MLSFAGKHARFSRDGICVSWVSSTILSTLGRSEQARPGPTKSSFDCLKLRGGGKYKTVLVGNEKNGLARMVAYVQINIIQPSPIGRPPLVMRDHCTYQVDSCSLPPLFCPLSLTASSTNHSHHALPFLRNRFIYAGEGTPPFRPL